MPVIHDPNNLTPVNRRIIERRQFDPLSAAQRTQFTAWQTSIDGIYPLAIDFGEQDLKFAPGDPRPLMLDAFAININGYQITWREMGSIINRWNNSQAANAPKPMTRQVPLDAYTKMICDYVNRIRLADKLTKRAEADKLAESEETTTRVAKGKKRARQDEAVSEDPFDGPPSCAMVTGEEFANVLVDFFVNPAQTKNDAERLLNDIRCTGKTFENLDYLFIPYIIRQNRRSIWGSHAVLIGIAPKQKFVFAINSSPNPIFTLNAPDIKILQHMLLSQLPDTEFAKENQTATGGLWRMYGSWSTRTKTLDDSPDSAQQGSDDDINCGIFTLTNAFCLAFGFDLLCYQQHDPGYLKMDTDSEVFDLDDLKKPRMAVEMFNGGFDGEFEYDMLELPTFVGRGQTTSADTATGMIATGDEEATADGRRTRRRLSDAEDPDDPDDSNDVMMGDYSDQFMDSSDDDQQGDDQKDDDDQEVEQGGLLTTEDDKVDQDSDLCDSGSEGLSDDHRVIGFRRHKLYTQARLRRALATTPQTTTPLPHDQVPFPPQFDAKFHQEAIFLYGPPSFFTVQDRKYSKRELMRVCRDFKLSRWRRWSCLEQKLFQRWVFSECGAVMARKRGDQIQPAPGMGWTLHDRRPEMK